MHLSNFSYTYLYVTLINIIIAVNVTNSILAYYTLIIITIHVNAQKF